MIFFVSTAYHILFSVPLGFFQIIDSFKKWLSRHFWLMLKTFGIICHTKHSLGFYSVLPSICIVYHKNFLRMLIISSLPKTHAGVIFQCPLFFESVCLSFLCQTSCSSGQFLCRHDQRCIDFHWTCDGEPDCSDGADESLCAGEGKAETNTSQVSSKSVL